MSHRKSWGAPGSLAPVWWRGGLLFTLVQFSGCTFLSSDRWGWLWFVVPFSFFAVSAYFVFERRRRQIDSWDLRVSPEVPSRGGIIRAVIFLAAAGFVAFAICNLAISMDDFQKGLNIGLWFLGTAIGSSLALFLGFRWAEPKALFDAPGEN